MDTLQPVEELLALIASFTLLGKTELKVALCVTNPQPPAFRFDPPLTKGRSTLLHCYSVTRPSLITFNSWLYHEVPEPFLPYSYSEPSNDHACMTQQRIDTGRVMGPNHHPVPPSFALTTLPNCSAPFPWLPTHPFPDCYPAAVPNTPQVNRTLRRLCLRWWSGGVLFNSVRMLHIHSPLAYSNQPSIIDAQTPPSNTHK